MDGLREWGSLLVSGLIALGGGIAWLFTFRNRDAEAKRIEAEADATTSGAWKVYADQLEAAIARTQDEVAALRREVDTLKADQSRLQAENVSLRAENVDLRERLNTAEDEIRALRVENEDLRNSLRAGARATLDEIQPDDAGEEPNDGH